MIEAISAAFIVISLVASVYYSFAGLTNPETLLPYAKANVPRWGVQVLSFLLGAGGVLLLFPQTFTYGGVLLMIHSCATIICYFLLKDWKGGSLELLSLQIPVFLLWAGYPISYPEKLKAIFI